MRRIIFLSFILFLAGNISFAKKHLIVGLADACGSNNTPTVGFSYVNALQKGGCIPIVIPSTLDSLTLRKLVKKLDVVFLTGGEDVAPSHYGEENHPKLGKINTRRDEWEFRLLEEAKRQHKPIFGTCRGEQIINIFFGGTLYQDIPSQKPSDIVHSFGTARAHRLKIAPDSRLCKVLGTTETMVNSSHHQAVKDLAPGFRIAAQAEDGVVEAIESDVYPVAAVQFHPEAMVEYDALFREIYKHFMKLIKK